MAGAQVRAAIALNELKMALLAVSATRCFGLTTLLCNMLAMAHLHPALSSALAAEQTAVLTGAAPDAPITSDLLGQMVELERFTLEVLRLHPPSRPCRVRLSDAAQLGGSALGAGAVLAPEPFVAHADPAVYERPAAFDPARFARGEPRPPLAFGGRVGEPSDGAGCELCVRLAQAAFVQLRRMFEEVSLGKDPAPTPSGYPAHTVPERAEVLLKPRMYYELQRGVKKLRF